VMHDHDICDIGHGAQYHDIPNSWLSAATCVADDGIL
jgi:hypothetical protein